MFSGVFSRAAAPGQDDGTDGFVGSVVASKYVVRHVEERCAVFNQFIVSGLQEAIPVVMPPKNQMLDPLTADKTKIFLRDLGCLFELTHSKRAGYRCIVQGGICTFLVDEHEFQSRHRHTSPVIVIEAIWESRVERANCFICGSAKEHGWLRHANRIGQCVFQMVGIGLDIGRPGFIIRGKDIASTAIDDIDVRMILEQAGNGFQDIVAPIAVVRVQPSEHVAARRCQPLVDGVHGASIPLYPQGSEFGRPAVLLKNIARAIRRAGVENQMFVRKQGLFLDASQHGR